ncbi:SPOR domain-containing protein [bacterium]|nr:SPOR domain-containing protein [bacterium]
MRIILLALFAFAFQPLHAETALELIEEGRLTEAIIKVQDVDSLARYQDYLEALLEVDAMRACSLYQLVSWRYPETDVDELAQERLLAFQKWGQSLPPFIAPKQALKAELEPETPNVAEQQVTVDVIEPAPEPDAIAEVPPPEQKAEEQPAPKIEKVVEKTTPPEPVKKAEKEPIPKIIETPVKAPSPELDIKEPSVKPIHEQSLVPHDVEPTPSGNVWVQVGAFGVRENADALVKELKAAGFPATVVSEKSTKSMLHHVRVGAYSSSEAALEVGKQLKQNFELNFYLVKK